jgi:hypothetical protein
MALPHWLTRVNLAFGNRLLRPFAAFLPGFGDVLAAGGCRVRNRGRWVALTSPRRFSDPRRREVPFLVRPILGLLRVSEFVELRAI